MWNASGGRPGENTIAVFNMERTSEIVGESVRNTADGEALHLSVHVHHGADDLSEHEPGLEGECR